MGRADTRQEEFHSETQQDCMVPQNCLLACSLPHPAIQIWKRGKWLKKTTCPAHPHLRGGGTGSKGYLPSIPSNIMHAHTCMGNVEACQGEVFQC